MPSEIMDLNRFSSSSFFSGDASFPNERQVGFWKSDTPASHNGREKPVASPPLDTFMPKEGQIMKSFEHFDSRLVQDQKVKVGLDRNAVGAERASNRSSTMSRSLDYNTVQPMPYFAENNKIDMMGIQYENNLFSSSMTELFNKKLRLAQNNAPYGHSVDTAASHYEEEEPLESTKEIEAQTIGNLLPDDDDLLSGVTEGLQYFGQPNGGDDLEELDLFNSVGGMDLGDDSSSIGQRNSEFPGGITNGQLGSSLVGEHPYGEHPSRTLFVRNINSNVEDSELKTLFEQFGDIRTLYTACKHRGFVMISYYDIRAARNAMKALQNKPLRRRKLDIHYSIPKDNPSEKDINQGTLVAFNLDTSISNDELLQIFGVYGEVKEIRETPHRSHHKFIEYYDIRAAEAALHGLNKSDIAGKQIKLEPSRPGGARRLVQQFSSELEQDEDGSYLQLNSPSNNSISGIFGSLGHGTITSSSMDNVTMLGGHSSIRSPISPYLETAFHSGISSSVPKSLPSLVRVQSAGNQSCLSESGHSQGTLQFDIRSTPAFHPHSLPEYQDGLTNCISPGTVAANISPRPVERIDNRQFCRVHSDGHLMELNDGVYGSSGNGSCLLPGHRYSWSNSYHPQPPGMMWPNSPSASFVNGMCTAHPPPRLHGLPRAPSHMLNSVLSTNNHHVGSAPAVNPSIWDRRNSYAGESQEASGFHPGSLGNTRMSTNSLHSIELASQNIFPHSGGNGMDMSIPPKNAGLQSHHQRCMMFPGRAQMIPMMNSFDSPNERVRSRRNEGGSNQADNKKQFELDIERIRRGEDNRTTLMIKNIPNKYTSKMLLAAIDEHHRGTYDFLYLPIDFKNKCNVGYAFINMTDPRQIIPFYQAFNGKKWEKFNSEKVASIAYARIQGKSALIAHFQNSSLMNEDKRCRPILFNTDGPNAGDQVPFPMGVNVRTRPGKNRGSSPNLSNGEDSSNGDSSSGSGRDSD